MHHQYRRYCCEHRSFLTAFDLFQKAKRRDHVRDATDGLIMSVFGLCGPRILAFSSAMSVACQLEAIAPYLGIGWFLVIDECRDLDCQTVILELGVSHELRPKRMMFLRLSAI